MSHQPFESWLVSDDPLSSDQYASLQAHLQLCESCRGLQGDWDRVIRILLAKPIQKPQPGFTQRWRIRLNNLHEEQRAYEEQKTSAIFLSSTLFLAFLTMAFMFIYYFNAYESSTQVLVGGISFITSLLTIVNISQQLMETLIQVLSGFIPPVWWITFAVAGGLLSLVWVEFLRRVIYQRRTIQ
jgi:hypothetical protein